MPVEGTVSSALMPASGPVVPLPDGLSIAEHLGDVVDMPGLSIYLNGQRIPRNLWARVKPKPGTKLVAVFPVHGGSKGGKNPLATIASVVVAAAAIAVTGGALGPAGLALSPALAGGTLGASIAGLAVGLAGQLLISALFPAPTPGIPKVKEGERFADQRIPGNPLEAGGVIPRVVGTTLITPPQGAQPITRIVNGQEQLSAFFVLAGPHKLEDVRINGSDAADVPQVSWETREGWDSDPPLSLVTEQNFVNNAAQELSTFRLDTIADSDDLDDQSNPDKASPQWHRFTSRSAPDQIDLRFQFVALQDSDKPTKQTGVPLRIRMRRKGDTAWRNLPELWFNGLFQSIAAREVRIVWGEPGGENQSNFGDPIAKNGFVGYKTSVPPSRTAHETQETWNADNWFGADTTDAVRRDKDGVTLYVDEADILDDQGAVAANGWPRAIYEIEVKRGQQFDPSSWNFSAYGYGSSSATIVKSMFDAERPSVSFRWSSIEPQSTKRSKVILSDIISRWHEHPMPRKGIAAVAIRANGISVQQFSVLASGYVQDWNGRDWEDWTTTSNPAPHYRHALVERENPHRLTAGNIDNDTIVAWRAECAAKGYRCNMLVGNDSVAGTLAKIAATGFATPRQADTWAVAFEHDRSAEIPRQIFTPYNSRGHTWRKSFEFQPSGIKTRFADRENDYQEREIITRNREDVQKRVPLEAIQYEGLDAEAEINRRAEYDMAQVVHRGVEHSIEISLEHLMARKGDLVGLKTDVISRYMAVREVKAASGSTLTLSDDFEYLDNDGFLEQTDVLAVEDVLAIGMTSYGAVHNAEGVSVRKITAWDDVNLVATLDSPPNNVEVGDRFIIGLGEEVFQRMLVRGITPLPGLRARLALIDEAPEIVAQLHGEAA